MRRNLWLVLGLLAFVAIVHGWNMFGFPYYENDEGVYLSQAWSLVYRGTLAPYTYWYDHAPAGWILTAIWIVLTRGVFTFGFSINSGRVLMLVIHLLSCLWLLTLGKRLTGKYTAGAIATLVFSLSPLGLYFQRRLLLDNIMVFWVLLGFCLLEAKKLHLRHVVFSALCVGVAILTKENAFFFLPGFLFLLVRRTDSRVRILWSGLWMFVMAGVVALYFLLALLKGELFASNTFLGGKTPHVSLIETLKYQSSREAGDSLKQSFEKWVSYDPIISYGGIGLSIALLGVAVAMKRWNYLAICLFTAGFWFFLVRGGIVIEFYVLPLIPLYGLAAGILMSRTKWVGVVVVIGMYLAMYAGHQGFGGRDTIDGKYLFATDQSRGQREAVTWMQKNLATDAFIVIDNYSYLEFHDPKNPTKKIFPNAHWYWKVDGDPEIRDGILKANPSNISYIARTPQMEGDMQTGVAPLAISAMQHSNFIKGFPTAGWGVELWATTYPNQTLQRTWQGYKKTFLTRDGRALDANQHGAVTSEGQSYSMLRAVWMNDKSTFDLTWNWTKANMQTSNGVFGWKWNNGALIDRGSASDADTDIATALLFAHKTWSDETYLTEAKRVIDGIWNTEVVQIAGRSVVVAGPWAKNPKEAIVNPSYLAPYAYRMFAEVDTSHNWLRVLDGAYDVLAACTTAPLDQPGPGVLPPNWCSVTDTGAILKPRTSGVDSSDYSYDAIRTLWRIGLDMNWYHDNRAGNLLSGYGTFLLKQWERDGRILVGYTHGGQPWEQYESAFASAVALEATRTVSPFVTVDIYNKTVFAKLYENYEEQASSYWEDPNNYYTQNWTWFGVGLYTDNLPNLWVKGSQAE